jgi:hypothetical protein
MAFFVGFKFIDILQKRNKSAHNESKGAQNKQIKDKYKKVKNKICNQPYLH